jgi:hypothetical protein
VFVTTVNCGATSQGKAFHNQTFTEMLDRLHAAVESLRDHDVRPSRSIGIRFEPNLSATELLR